MSGSSIIQVASKAYASQSFYEYLTGKCGYAIPSYFPQIDTPTDWTIAIPAIYALYEKDAGVKNAYEEAIRETLNGTVEDLWCGGNVLYFQRDQEMSNESPFEIDRSLFTELKKQLLNKKEDMLTFFPHGKKNWDSYNDILRLNHNFKMDWNKCLWD